MSSVRAVPDANSPQPRGRGGGRVTLYCPHHPHNASDDTDAQRGLVVSTSHGIGRGGDLNSGLGDSGALVPQIEYVGAQRACPKKGDKAEGGAGEALISPALSKLPQSSHL